MMDHVGKTNTKQKHVVKAKWKKQRNIRNGNKISKRMVSWWESFEKQGETHSLNQWRIYQLVNVDKMQGGHAIDMIQQQNGKKAWSCHVMGAQEHHVKSKSPDTSDEMMHDCTYLKHPQWTNLQGWRAE